MELLQCRGFAAYLSFGGKSAILTPLRSPRHDGQAPDGDCSRRRALEQGLGLGFAAHILSTMGRPQVAAAEVQYELGPVKVRSEDDPALQPKLLDVPQAVDPSSQVGHTSFPSCCVLLRRFEAQVYIATIVRQELEVTDQASLEITVNGASIGSLTIDLFGK